MRCNFLMLGSCAVVVVTLRCPFSAKRKRYFSQRAASKAKMVDIRSAASSHCPVVSCVMLRDTFFNQVFNILYSDFFSIPFSDIFVVGGCRFENFESLAIFPSIKKPLDAILRRPLATNNDITWTYDINTLSLVVPLKRVISRLKSLETFEGESVG
jgi:hypothetical protein